MTEMERTITAETIDFTTDWEKMRDFFEMPRDEFLASYSYLTEAEYDATLRIVQGSNPEIKEEPKLMLYTFGCNTYSGKLVSLQIPATTRREAERIARKMAEAAREIVDIDEGLWLNDEEVYE